MVQLQHRNMVGRYNLGRQRHKEKQLSNLMAQSGDVAPRNREQFAGNVMAAGGLNEVQMLRNTWANSDNQKRAAIKRDVEGLAKTLFTVKQNPQAWGRVRQEIIRAKPEYAAVLPEQFDPVWADQKINEARSFEGLFNQQKQSPTKLQKLFELDASIPEGDPRKAMVKQALEKETSTKNPLMEQLGIMQTQLGISNARQQAKDRAQQSKRDQETHNLKIQKERVNIGAAKKTAKKARSSAESLLTLGKALLTDDGGLESYSGASGVLPTVRPSQKSWEGKLARLQSALTLENTDQLTGILSDTDIKLLQNSASSLVEGGDTDQNRMEIERIINTIEEGIGTPITDFTKGKAKGRGRNKITSLVDKYAD